MKRRTRKPRITRRQFLTYTAAAGAVLPAGTWLTGCGDDGSSSSSGDRPTEPRTFYFDFSTLDASQHDLTLVAGTSRYSLNETTAEVRQGARRRNNFLALVEESAITHYLEDIPLPADSPQLCYVQRSRRGATDGKWDLAMLFYHLPEAAIREARGSGRFDPNNLPAKWRKYGIDDELLSARGVEIDPLEDDSFKTFVDQAVAMTFSHPEVLSAEPMSAAYIQSNIISPQSGIINLAIELEAQGPATENGGWATQQPLIDPTTNRPYRNSKDQIQYVPRWSDTTLMATGQAVNPTLDQVKDDRTLGANITDLRTGSFPGLTGKIWKVRDGITTVVQPAAPQADTPEYAFKNQSPEHGYRASFQGVSPTGLLKIHIENWFVRYLGVYVRYLDGAGNPIPISQLPASTRAQFPAWTSDFNGTYDMFAGLLGPEWDILGIPVGESTFDIQCELPGNAASLLVLAGGIGHGDNSYPDTLIDGKVMTGAFCLAIPTFFLILGAGAAVGDYFTELRAEESAVSGGVVALFLMELLSAIADTAADVSYDTPAQFADLGINIGQFLLTAGATALVQFIAKFAAEGESEEAVTDSMPIVGLIVNVVAAAGTAAQIVETSAEVGTSPNTYASEIVATHDVTATIQHDPNHTAGFPSTATYYTVTAIIDGGTPHVISACMPVAGGMAPDCSNAPTRTNPIPVTFRGIPFGGKITLKATFYSQTGWIAGAGTVGPIENNVGALEFCITENAVPLSAQTRYTHKEKTVLDANGNHVWQVFPGVPAVDPNGRCENRAGQICSYGSVTVSDYYAALGYSWQSFSPGIASCGGGGNGQLHQFANVSTSQNPQSGYLFSGCGFNQPVRLAYDLLGRQNANFYLDTTGGKNLIRQIRFDEPPVLMCGANAERPPTGSGATFDGPLSNLAWGRLRFQSDALLLHPLGKVISINRDLNKLEVVDLPTAAVADAQAPISQVYAGIGTREGRVKAPVLAALTTQGTILVLEATNARIQAFDVSGNPVPYFDQKYFTPLRAETSPATYLDLAVEYAGYMYVLSYTGQLGAYEYHLDIYKPDGTWLARSAGLNAAKITVDYFRDVFALNYETLMLPNGSLPSITEPSLSHWIPTTPTT